MTGISVACRHIVRRPPTDTPIGASCGVSRAEPDVVQKALTERRSDVYPMESATTPEGQTVFVARDETDRGSKAPFFVAYSDADRERTYGWCCGHCDGFDVAMDTMGRIECNACGNIRKPTEWDAAHE